jgi:hypothetical protein
MRARPAKGNAIPTKSREAVKARDGDPCFRCGLMSTDVHHRRSRRVRDEHTNCACNLIRACRACHSAIHRRPADSMALGLIVGRDVDAPTDQPVLGYAGWQVLNCDGTITYLTGPPHNLT